MDSGPYPFGRSVIFVVPGEPARVFKSRDAAVAALGPGGAAYEFVERSGEFLAAYRHDRDGQTMVLDVAETDRGTVARYFPDVTALEYDRYGDLSRWTRGLEEFEAFWERVRDSELPAAGGPAEERFLRALRDCGRGLAFAAGGLVAVDEMDAVLAADPA